MAGRDRPWTRRRFVGAGAALAAGWALAACGDDASVTPSTGASGGFPRTVDHAVGSTVVATKPARIVAATDGAELAALLALGVKPVGFGQRSDPLTPWIAEAGGSDQAIERYALASDTNFEKLASWRPDLIVGQYGFVTEDTIAAYQAVAPTVATSFVEWRTSLRQVGAAVGEDARAKALITETEAEIAATAKRLAGSDVTMRWIFGFPDYIGQLDDRSPIGALLTEMGLPSLAQQALFRNALAVTADRVVRLGVDDSNDAYFDSVLTVRRNLALIERVLGELR